MKEHQIRYKYLQDLIKNPYYSGSFNEVFDMTSNDNNPGTSADSEKHRLPEFSDKNEHLMYWLEPIPQIKYQPLHWLAYWNDHMSVDFLLSTFTDSSHENNIKQLLLLDKDGYTALDFAGMHQSFETLLIFIEYFKQQFHHLEAMFNSNNKNNESSEESQDNLP